MNNMKKAKVKYYANDDTETEVVVVENMEDYEEYGRDYVNFPSTLLICLEQVDKYGPVVINSSGGMCNLKHLNGDNSEIVIYE